MERAISGGSDGFTILVRQRFRSDPEGDWVHLRSRGRVVKRDVAGRARRIMGTFEDVTEARLKARAEQERELAMARTERMASLGILATSLAHDLNQPLTALTSYLEGTVRLLSKGQASENEIQEALERSVSFAHRAPEAVRRFRRMLRGGTPLRDRVDLSSLPPTARDGMNSGAADSAILLAAQMPFLELGRGAGTA